jgi:hypothetical protein
MTATLLAPLPYVQSPAIPEGAAPDSPFLEPFPLLCAAICITRGRLKTVSHHCVPAIVLDQTHRFRRIWTADDFENRREPFWILRWAADEKRLRSEHRAEKFARRRLQRTLQPPVWHGEKYPSGYRAVKLQTEFPSLLYLIKLCRDFGYTWSAAGAALPQAHAPWAHPHSDKRRNACTGLSDIEGDAESGGDYRNPQYFPQSGSQEYFDVEHPYVPASPARRMKVGGGLTRQQVQEGLKSMRVDENTKEALIEIVYQRRSTRDVAAQRGLHRPSLYVYASRLRVHVKQSLREGKNLL